MAGGIRIDTRELDRAIDKLARDTLSMPETHAAVAGSLLPGVRQRTPVRTGELAASWEAAGEADRGSISSDVPYANIVESREHPVADAIAGSEREIVAKYEAGIERMARKIGFEVKR